MAGPAKVLQHTRRGLRMVGEQTSLFDLSEPVWHPDEKVSVAKPCDVRLTVCVCVCYRVLNVTCVRTRSHSLIAE